MYTYQNGTAALQFPSSYVLLTEEEMTYVDGGISIANWIISGAVNVTIDIILGAAGYSFARNGIKYLTEAGKLHFSKTITAKLVAKGVANSVAGVVCTRVMTFIGGILNPGEYVANYLDCHDRCGKNGKLDL